MMLDLIRGLRRAVVNGHDGAAVVARLREDLAAERRAHDAAHLLLDETLRRNVEATAILRDHGALGADAALRVLRGQVSE